MIRIVPIDDTSAWTVPNTPNDCKFISVYAYDDTIGVNCCEITLSRELHFLGTIPTIVPEDETERETFLNIIMECDNENERITYMHCSSVDNRKYIKSVFDDGETEDENLENTIEDFLCNESRYEMELISLIKDN